MPFLAVCYEADYFPSGESRLGLVFDNTVAKPSVERLPDVAHGLLTFHPVMTLCRFEHLIALSLASLQFSSRWAVGWVGS